MGTGTADTSLTAKSKQKSPFKGWFGVALLVGLLVLIFLAVDFFFSGKENFSGSLIPEVSIITLRAKDTPVNIEFVGQTESSHQVEIRARVNGFLDQRTYSEGKLVQAGEQLFQMDPKPFETQLEAQKGALAEQEARLQTAQSNLNRVEPLVKLNALSQKDLDDAKGQQQAAAAAVEVAKANVDQAELNLGYTTISSPILGLSSYARVQDGTYINPQNNLLTYVYQTDPIWVNFSVSENDVLKYRGDIDRGFFRAPPDNSYLVEVILADGSLFPEKGRITFTDAEYNQQTGTFLVRATLANPNAILRPGQFLRVRLKGGLRPKAIAVPQQVVFEGAQGRFVWVVDKNNKAEVRNVETGALNGNQWFIEKGLNAGDKLIVNGIMKLSIGKPVKVVESSSSNSKKSPAGAGGNRV